MDRKCPICKTDVDDGGRCREYTCSVYSHKVHCEITEITEKECEECDGDGRVMYAHCSGGEHSESYKECDECCGSGYVEVDDD